MINCLICGRLMVNGRRTKARIARITELLDTLVTLGQAREMEDRAVTPSPKKEPQQ